MILDDILAQRKIQLDREMKERPLVDLMDEAKKRDKIPFPLEQVLRERDLSLIAEVKKASPSKGLIAKDFQPLPTALAYEEAGAGAISVLTEEHYFQGNNRYLEEIAAKVRVPVLRKDFVIDPYQIWHAKALGASVVLLIAAILTDGELRDFRGLADRLGMDAILEVHTEEELERGIRSGARIIGINNRDLRTFQVDVQRTVDLMKKVPEGMLVISESGLTTKDDIDRLRKAGVRGVLIGETLMRSGDVAKAIRELGL